MSNSTRAGRRDLEEESAEGPAVPPNFRPEAISSSNHSASSDSNVCGPSLPSTETAEIGPSIPAHLLARSAPVHESFEDEDEDEDAYAPALPPDLVKSRHSESNAEPKGQQSARRRQPVGPSMPAQFGSTYEDDDDYAGPALPPSGTDAYNDSDVNDTVLQIERRAQRALKESQPDDEDDDQPKKRGEWMLVPPKNKSLTDVLKAPEALMKSRGFSSSQRDIDRDNSEWTETPEERAARKRAGKEKKRKRHDDEPMSAAVRHRDQQIRQDVEQHNNREYEQRNSRPKTLMEMHAEKMMKDKKYEEHDVKKQSWDRERDINANMISGSKLRERLTKAGGLGDRFGGSRKGTFM